MGFRVWRLGFRGSGFKGVGRRLRVWDFRFDVWCSGDWGLGFGGEGVEFLA